MGKKLTENRDEIIKNWQKTKMKWVKNWLQIKMKWVKNCSKNKDEIG